MIRLPLPRQVIAALSVGLLASGIPVAAQTPDAKTSARLAPIGAIKSPQPLGYVMALLRDRSGYLWVGTEGQGLWRYDPTLPNAKAWTQFATKDGLGDDFCYTLAQDFQGRIWVGHATSGASVWNGREWANYGIVEDEDRVASRQGPLGERVFNIAVSPSNGDVFLGTSEGLSIYSVGTNSWSCRTRRDGLPSNQIQSLAFDSLANLYVGTQSDGLAKGNSDSDFKSWQLTRGALEMPNAVAGPGLPLNAINDLLVSDDNTVYVSTKWGLARSNDLGDSWTFLRGVGWEKHVQNRLGKPAPQPVPEDLNRQIPREDYATSLAEDANGLLLLAFRARGYEWRRPLTDRVPFLSTPDDKPNLTYISAILPQAGGAPLLGFYGDGLKVGEAAPAYVPSALEKEQARRNWKSEVLPPLPATFPPLPASAKAPSLDEIDALLKPFSALRTPFPVGSAIYEGDDWRTKGDWVGRYGRDYSVLCAARARARAPLALRSIITSRSIRRIRSMDISARISRAKIRCATGFIG